ncbi:hypothetical protein [Pedobacter alpinus]|uniref:Peptidase M48 domain-containing protein n=1 Tax=Pedobacter alpinus TaxID=1590643 RepID=A0ABW5TST7_9SPHI
MFKKVGIFESISIYESSLFKKGHGLTIPNKGIVTFVGCFSKAEDMAIIKHEFGHILQFRKLGSLKFYLKVGLPSLWSAIRASVLKNYVHQNHTVEVEAKYLAYHYFNEPKDWNVKRFPIV